MALNEPAGLVYDPETQEDVLDSILYNYKGTWLMYVFSAYLAMTILPQLRKPAIIHVDNDDQISWPKYAS